MRWCAWSALFFAVVTGCAMKQAVQSRKKAIEATKGAEVTGGEFEQTIRYVGRVRVYASEEYRARRSNWRNEMRDVIDSTSEVLGPAFGLRLEVEETRSWDPTCEGGSLAECIDELAQHDPASDVDWVLGLISAVPRFTTSFNELGMGVSPGKHLVLRDLYAQGEREAIKEMFPHMTSSKRNEIYRERQEHKHLVLLLHEWGHTLGAMHTRDEDTIMYPAYSSKMASFGDANLRLVDASLGDRFPFDPGYTKLSEFIVANDSEQWVRGERERVLTGLELVGANVQRSRAARGTQAVLSGNDDRLLEGVSEEDRQLYAKAHQQYEAGELDASWETLWPLVDRYPKCHAIQHFGCTVAMQVGAREQAGKACRRAIELLSNE
jgi:hypothetical protein